MKALILAADFHFQYRVVRCAANAGLSVFVLGEEKAAPLRYSLFCHGFFKLNCSMDKAANQPQIIEQINQLITLKAINIILPADGFSTRLLADINQFIDRPVFPIPPTDVFNLLDNKMEFAKLCTKLDITHPTTKEYADIESLGAAIDAREINFPFIIKPPNLFGGLGVNIIRENDMAALAARISYAPILAQEYIEGEDICISMLCHEGQTYSQVIYKKRKGIFYFFDEPQISEYAAKVAKHFSFNGVICFDGIIAASGKTYMLECNPRFWFNMDISMFAGANFIKQALDYKDSRQDFRKERILPSIRTMRGIIARMPFFWKFQKSDLAVILYCLSDPMVCLFLCKCFLAQKFGRKPCN